MNDDDRTKEALFRHAILGEVLSRSLRKGQLRRMLAELSGKTFEDYRGRPRQMAYKTLEEWLYRYRSGGFEALKPRPRSDLGICRVLTPEQQELVLDLKREDPGRSAYLIRREMELAGRLKSGQASLSVLQRLLRRNGLSGPRMELDRPARYRWQASMCGELWQADALHGPVLINPAAGRPQRTIIFGLIDDRSRIIPYVEAGFGESEHRFLAVLYNAVARRGIVRHLLVDNHASFNGSDLRLLCAKLNIRLVHSRPGDGPGKGKIERFWGSLRRHTIARLNLEEVTTVEELNLRIWSYIEGEYHHRPHSGLAGKTPLEVWESGADEVRWASDPGELEQAFYGEVDRLARNDSTVQWRGSVYEVPTHLRRQTVRLRYSLLDPSRVAVLDHNVEVPIRPVQSQDNAHRSRAAHPPAEPAAQKPASGLNAPDLFLDHITGQEPEQEDGDDE